MKVVRDEGGAIVDYEDEEFGGCCALAERHVGPCAYLCPECGGTQKCWACGGHDTHDDLGSGCTECDGRGNCLSCYEGMVD